MKTIHYWPKHTHKFICGKIPKPQDKYVFSVNEVTCNKCIEALKKAGILK